MVTDNALDDRAAQQQPVIADQGSAGVAQMIFGFLGDCGRREPTKFDDLRPIDVSGRKRVAGTVELSSGVDAEGWAALPLNGRGVRDWGPVPIHARTRRRQGSLRARWEPERALSHS